MSFQWLQMRITEEKERQRKESRAIEHLPTALEEVRQALANCIENYTGAFGSETAQIEADKESLKISVFEQKNGTWDRQSQVVVTALATLPGLVIDRPGTEPISIVVGLLPSERLYYREEDKYLTMDDLTRRILDRALFPKLGD